MILEKTMSERWLSNSWLVADKPGGHGVIIDTGGPREALLQRVRDDRLTITHILNTHHHHDHVAENLAWHAETSAPVLAHPSEREWIAGCEDTIEDGAELTSGALTVRVLHIPGHTVGQLAFLVTIQGESVGVFTGDTLFKGSIGGNRGPGHTTFEDLRGSIMETLFGLPHETRILPGHMEPSTLAAEWEQNPFVRAFRGLDPPGDEAVTVRGKPARLRLEARDYDGGTKAWVVLDGVDAVVPGSAVKRGG